MKILVATMAFLLSVSAHADIINCHFTEPFRDFQYSFTQSKLTAKDYSNYPTVKTTVTNAVSFQIIGPAEFQLRNSANQIIARLYLNNEGSDGMSDTVYPYTVRWKGQWGGCTSNFLHADQPMTILNPQ